MNAELIKALQANRDQRRAEKERESIDSETYSLNQIRDAAYEVLSRLPESEYEYAERLLWSFNEELEGESNE
jgi:ERCC4-type nuclease